MKRSLFALFWFCCCVSTVVAQEFLPIWSGNMPNSRGIVVHDSIARERIMQVGTPAIHAYFPSKAENNGTAVLIIPGGGYVRLAYEVSGIALAKWFNTMGVSAFVLQHRFPTSPDVEVSWKAPLQDAQRAMRYIRAHAADWGIDTTRIGVMGCSAGGHLSASLATIPDDWSAVGDTLDAHSYRPNFAILISPVISMADSIVHAGSRRALLGEMRDDAAMRHFFSLDHQVSASTPPTLLLHASDDKSVSSLNSVAFYKALKNAGVTQSSLHIFPMGRHAISLRRQPGSTALWPTIAEMWMEEVGVLVPLRY